MDQKRIYHIFKACRLCGASGGYKMPIYQNFVDLNDTDLDIGQKIRDCVQIEVYDGDKMPPLICEMCIDKIDEYNNFKQLCKETNVNTRKILGLPVNIGNLGKPNSTDETIGKQITPIKKEPDEKQIKIEAANAKKETALKEKETQLKNKAKELKTKEESLKKKDTTLKSLNVELKTRHQELVTLQEQLNAKEIDIKQKEIEKEKEIANKNKQEINDLKKEIYNMKRKETYSKNRQQQMQKQFDSEIEKLNKQISDLKAKSKSVKRKKESEQDEVDRSSRSSSVCKAAKRSKRSQTPTKQEDPAVIIDTPKTTVSNKTTKRLKTSQTPNKQEEIEAKIENKKIKAPSPKSTKLSPPPEADKILCVVCGAPFKYKRTRSKHMKLHTVTFTSPRLACDACKLWFTTIEEVNNHHKTHKTNNIPYKCDSCYMEYSSDSDYQEHFTKQDCIRFYVVPDVQCLDCWNYFATETLKCQHKCLGEDGRPGGKCSKCNVEVAVWKELVIHEATCKGPVKAPSSDSLEKVKVDPEILDRLLPMHVRLIKCDTLINRNENGYCNVGDITHCFGLDKTCVYPYLLQFKIKQEPIIPIDHMVSINPDLEDEFYSKHVHWDSDDIDSDDDQPKAINSLTTLCLKIIFSKQMLGKVPKKTRKVETIKAFDAMSDNDGEYNIDNIIDSLDVDIDSNKAVIDDIDLEAKLNKEEDNIKLLRIDIESDNEEVSKNKSLKDTDSTANDIVNQTNESQSKSGTAQIKPFPQVVSFESNDNLVQNDTHNIQTDKDIPIDNSKEIEQNTQDLNGVNINLNSISNDPSEIKVKSHNHMKSNDINNENSENDEKQMNIDFKESNEKQSIVDDIEMKSAEGIDEFAINEKSKNNIDDIEMEASDPCEVSPDKRKEMQKEDDLENCDEIHINDNKVVVNNTENDKNHEVINEEKPTADRNSLDCEKILENDTKVEEHKTESDLNDEIKNRTEMDTLMKDLSDLSKTDDTQLNVTNENNTNNQKTDSDSENDKFMKELDEQIGENNEQTDNLKENNYNETNIEKEKGNSDEDLNKINKELEQRMENDLDIVSDEEFNFDA